MNRTIISLASSSKIKSSFKFQKKLLVTCCTLAIGLIAQGAAAQIGSATVKGSIATQKLPQAGVEVIAKNVDNGFLYHAITLKDGTYTFKGLNPGRYQVYLHQQSQTKPQELMLAVGQNYALNFEISKLNDEKAEEITVTGVKAIPNIGGEISTNISQQQINRLPQNTRNFLAFADLAPGVQFTQSDDGSTRIKSGSQSANSINVFIDGVGQKNYVTGGGIAGQDSSRGNPFPQSAIAQYKVITQNYSAEYDQLSSAAVVAVTASGGNEFHGSAFYDYTDQDMREMRPAEIKDNQKVKSKK